MGYIVCATRGGAGSRAVQERAIQHASQRGQKLIFLYVIDTSRLSEADEPLHDAVELELDWLGRTLLRIAQIRSENAGIESTVVIRKGQVIAEICRFISEQSAELLSIEILAERICSETGVAVEVVRPDSGESLGPSTTYCGGENDGKDQTE